MKIGTKKSELPSKRFKFFLQNILIMFSVVTFLKKKQDIIWLKQDTGPIP